MAGNTWVIGLTITICSFFFYLFLTIVYFRKDPKYNLKNYLYRRILTFGFVGYALDFLYFLLCRYTTEYTLIVLTRKFSLLTFIGCLFLWVYYMILLIFEKYQDAFSWIRKNRASIDVYSLIGFITISIITLILPVHTQLDSLKLIQSLTGPAFAFCIIIIIVLSLIPIPFIVFYREIIVKRKRCTSYIVINKKQEI